MKNLFGGVVRSTSAESLAEDPVVVGTEAKLFAESLAENLLGGAGGTSAEFFADDPVVGVESKLFTESLEDLRIMFSNTFVVHRHMVVESTELVGK